MLAGGTPLGAGPAGGGGGGAAGGGTAASPSHLSGGVRRWPLARRVDHEGRWVRAWGRGVLGGWLAGRGGGRGVAGGCPCGLG
jgi:hypothetical protein